MKTLLDFAVACGMVLAGFAGRALATEYMFTTIDYPRADGTLVNGINDAGQMVGLFGRGNSYHAFSLFDGVFTTFDHPLEGFLGRGGGTTAEGINSAGQIVGAYSDASGIWHGYLRNGDDYSELVPDPDSPETRALQINDSGHAVGYYVDADNVGHGFFFDGASYATLDFPGAAFTLAGGINNGGSIVGYATFDLFDPPVIPPLGFLLENGVYTPIDVLDFEGHNATDINELGQIVGITGPAPDRRCAFVLSGGQISILRAPGAVETIALDINNLGHVVGQYSDVGGRWHGYMATPIPELQAGDADMDLDFDQLDLVQVQVAAKYLTGEPATWGEGDWNGAPGGSPGNPPDGDGVFNQLDIVAALAAGVYLTGPYKATEAAAAADDGQTSLIYDAKTGELAVDVSPGTELTSINIDSASGIFTGAADAMNLIGSFDHAAKDNLFKAVFGSSFGSLSFGNVAQAGLAEPLVRADLSVFGSLAGGGNLNDVSLIYIPEPTGLALLALAFLSVGVIWPVRRQR